MRFLKLRDQGLYNLYLINMTDQIICAISLYIITGILIFWGFGDNPKTKPLVFVAFVPIFNYMIGFFAILHIIDRFVYGGCKLSHKYLKEEDNYKCQKCGKTL